MISFIVIFPCLECLIVILDVDLIAYTKNPYSRLHSYQTGYLNNHLFLVPRKCSEC